MHVRDAELERMHKYAESLGLKVIYRKCKGEDVGAVVTAIDGVPQTLTLYSWPGKSKTQQVLDFSHELAHMISFIYKGRRDSQQLLDALVEEGDRKPGDKPISKRKRKLIYECERKDSEYRANVIAEMNIKVPEYKWRADVDLDNWFYHYFYINGNYPTHKMILEKKKELRNKYRGQ